MTSESAEEIFDHIPEEWACMKLIACTTDGNISYGIVQPGQHTENGVPVIRVNNVNNGQLLLKDVLKVAPEVEAKYKRTRLVGGEVLLTLVGSTGQSFVAPEELAGWNVPRAIAVIRPKEEIGAGWINICLQSKPVQHFLDVRANTTVQKTLNLKDVRDIPIPIPPKHIKESIESIAVSLQGKIELNRQINQTLEQIAQTIFKSWFVDFEPVKAKIAARKRWQAENETIETSSPTCYAEEFYTAQNSTSLTDAMNRAAMRAVSGKTDEELDQLSSDQRQQLASTAALFPDELEDSELGEIPKGWETKKVGDVVKRLKSTKRYTKKQVDKHGLIPVFEQGANILLGYHNEEAGFVATPDEPLFIFGDHTCITHLSCRPFDISQNVIPLSGNVYPTLWVYYAILGKQSFQEYRRHWSEFIIKDIIVPQPALADHFSELVVSLYKKTEQSVSENSLLAQIRDSTLPKLLSGELTPDNTQSKMELTAS